MLVGDAQITSRPPPFVEILREQGKVTQERLDEALRIQASERKYIGQILCEIAPLTAADIEAALTLQESSVFSEGARSLAGRAEGAGAALRARRTAVTPGDRDLLAPQAAAGTRVLAPVPVRPTARTWRRPDLSAPFTVTLMIGLMSAALFISVVIQQGVPLGRVLSLAVADPFGAMALMLLAAAAVMVRIGDV